MQGMGLVTDLYGRKHHLLQQEIKLKLKRDLVALYSNLEHILLIDKMEPTECSLQIVQSLPHITISCEYYGLKAFWHVRNLRMV